MTDKEIIKDLECCANCEDCFYGITNCSLGEEVECRSLLAQNALDLITRQQAEIDNLKVENQSLRSAANSLKMHYEEAQAEVERLKENLNIELDNFASEYDDKIKAKAYKEFAERLKNSFFDNGYESPDVDFDYFVDNLVKEME